MSRHIKFRGKRKDTNEWVYGSVAYRLGNHPCIIVNEPVKFPNGKMEDDFVYYDYIYEDSIGQFTGLLDANGKDIYEGDIVKFRVLDDTISENVWKEYIYEVSFCNGCFCTYGTPLIKGKWKGYDTVNVKIIGNIHDTPELLNEK